MSVIEKLASSQNIRNTNPNKALAEQLTKTKNTAAIKELVANLHTKGIQSDCIKVLYEIGERNPKLIAPYATDFISLLDSKNNRMQWGAMTALDCIAAENPDLIYNSLGKIIAAADKGSVITTDHCVGILLTLCSIKKYAINAFDLFTEQLQKAPTNQLPAYAEKAVPVINSSNKARFLSILADRLPEVDKDTKRKRIEKVIKKLS